MEWLAKERPSEKWQDDGLLLDANVIDPARVVVYYLWDRVNDVPILHGVWLCCSEMMLYGIF